MPPGSLYRVIPTRSSDGICGAIPPSKKEMSSPSWHHQTWQCPKLRVHRPWRGLDGRRDLVCETTPELNSPKRIQWTCQNNGKIEPSAIFSSLALQASDRVRLKSWPKRPLQLKVPAPLIIRSLQKTIMCVQAPHAVVTRCERKTDDDPSNLGISK